MSSMGNGSVGQVHVSRPFRPDRFLVRSLPMAALEPCSAKSCLHALRSAAGPGRRRHRQDACGDLSDRRLIRHGTRPDRILAVTFTNKAASEMQQRVGAIAGQSARRTALRSPLSTPTACRSSGATSAAWATRSDSRSTTGATRRAWLARCCARSASATRRCGRAICCTRSAAGSRVACARHEAANLAQTDKEHLAAMAFRRYQRALKNAGAVDFDDILLCTEELFDKHADVLDEEAGLFDHLLVDEYQDTNGSQYRIVRALAGKHRNLCVVGDDDQSIYGWRGAEVEHILRFTRDWPDATVVRLEDNYRSTSEIIEHANRLIVFNKTRHDKVLRAARPGGEKPRILQCKDETEEARAVVDEIRRQLRQPGVEPGDIAILFRTNEQPRAFEAEMRRVKIPYVLIGGTSFFDRKEVRDILAYLKLLVMPRDETSLLRIINTPPRGIGSRTVETLMGTAVEQRMLRVGRGLRGSEPHAKLPAKATAAVHQLAELAATVSTAAESGHIVAGRSGSAN